MPSSKFQCPQCEFTCGRSQQFEKHLREHGWDSVEAAYVFHRLGGVAATCRCGCGSGLTFYGWNRGYPQFLKGHNANLQEAYTEEEAAAILERRKVALRGKTGWSQGLTKETDERLARAAKRRSATVLEQFRSGERRAWSKGLTHESDPRVGAQRRVLIGGYASGEYTSWAKGKTKETDPRVARMGEAVSRSLMQREVRERLDSLKRLSDEEVVRRLEGIPGLRLVGGLEDYSSGKDRCLQLKCESCDQVQVYSLVEAMSGRCRTCSPAGSRAQVEIDRYIRSLGFETELSTRGAIGPYEIDTYVPERRFGVEYNGLYFHSAIFKNKGYHSLKSRLCRESDIELMHVFEDEWRDRRSIVESMISHRLGRTQERVGARGCNLVEIARDDRATFFESNHIDGDVKATAAAGLIDRSGRLVSCMSLRRPLHRKHVGALEVARFSSLVGVSVPGGLGRLTSWAEGLARRSGVNRLITYVDTRHGIGRSYESSGWSQVGETPERFWWTDGRARIDRFKIRADPEAGLSEQQVAGEHGVVKIWGCPNLVLERKIE